ncbi:DUF6252 family protein [Mucilaginibacter jinjuensis]|uniref:DUF6252 family protein n=1 Tax=Mucilaginibacter jinjuensis TaxID=1176721 RepID=A0ABY7T6H3_9SPHI|nr:DUF6252 family protein [Mucilaginibacter jinjuensis]WCT11363.1 DUF6252 family protein [Mucilaginibacter jinjuensis]
MKQLKVALLLAVLSITLFSCKKDSKDDSQPDSSKPSMSFKLNGTLEQTSIAPVAQWYTSSGANNTLQVLGQVSTTEGIGLGLENPKVGTYDVVKDNLIVAYTSKTDTYQATSGSITITAFSGSFVTGTFQFTGTNFSNSKTVTITEGKFTSSVSKL